MKIHDDVLHAIDIDEWKHSWHLKRNKCADVDWMDEDNIRQCKRVILDKIYSREHELKLLRIARDAINIIDVSSKEG